MAIQPASAAISAILKRALAYSGGPPADLDSAVAPTVSTLKKAANQLSGIGAPEPVHRDILDVASAMSGVVGDLTTLGAARGSDVQTGIARLVADAGRESAADNLVRLTINLLTTPTTQPPATEVPSVVPTTTTTTLAPATTGPRHTTTTRPKTTTTIHRATSTTGPHTSTSLAGR